MRVEGLEKWEDRIKACELGNGNTIYYVERNGVDFEVGIYLGDKKTLEVYNQVDYSLMDILNSVRHSKHRIRIWYGDKDTGRSWNEEYSVTGTVGRTCGIFKEPILLSNCRSCFGGAILVGSLIRVDDITSHRTLWKVSNFHVEKMSIEHRSEKTDYPYAVMCTKDNGAISNIANFKTEIQAKRWIDFMNGASYRK